MAPEETGNLVVLELEWRDADVVCIVHRYEQDSSNSKRLRVSWAATKCPSGYVSLAGGVTYVRRPPGYLVPDPYSAQPSKRDARYSWTDTPSADGLMLILVLPAEYVLPSVDDADPMLVESKEFNGRMALYWLVPKNEDPRQEFSWRMEKVQYTTAELKTRCSSLNHEAAERRKRANEDLPSPVILDTDPRNALLRLITHWTFITGLVIFLIGLAFIFVGSSGNTNFTLFGQSFASTNIGIAAIFVGVIMIVINIGRVLAVIMRDSQR